MYQGKAVEKRYRFTLSISSALYGCRWSKPCSGRFSPRKKSGTQYRKLGGPQGRYGRVRKISPPTSIRPPERPVRSELLYQLRYRGPLFGQIYRLIVNMLVVPYTQFCYLFRRTVPSSGGAHTNADTASHSL